MSERLFLLGRKLPAAAPDARVEPPPATDPIAARGPQPDWVQADPRDIGRALERALARPSGGWVVVDASRVIRSGPRKYTLAGRELVAWWCHEGPRLAPDFCPHMGAELSKGSVDREGRIVCPWHGLALDGSPGRRRGSFEPLVTHDDGVLTWARLPELLGEGEALTERPFLPARPTRFLDAVIRMEAACEPRDVIANRLDPWHGAHFHPHSFARLRVVDRGPDHITVRVVYRIAGRVGMEVDARFDCPDPRTIVMTIVEGEGVGSVVETHATPLGPGRTAIVEATLATSERRAVISWLPGAGRLLRPLVQQRARKLWVEDADYCERTYALRRDPKT
jgi:isorenieratene synthase